MKNVILYSNRIVGNGRIYHEVLRTRSCNKSVPEPFNSSGALFTLKFWNLEKSFRGISLSAHGESMTLKLEGMISPPIIMRGILTFLVFFHSRISRRLISLLLMDLPSSLHPQQLDVPPASIITQNFFVFGNLKSKYFFRLFSEPHTMGKTLDSISRRGTPCLLGSP